MSAFKNLLSQKNIYNSQRDIIIDLKINFYEDTELFFVLDTGRREFKLFLILDDKIRIISFSRDHFKKENEKEKKFLLENFLFYNFVNSNFIIGINENYEQKTYKKLVEITNYLILNFRKHPTFKYFFLLNDEPILSIESYLISHFKKNIK